MLPSAGWSWPSGATTQKLQVLTHYFHPSPLLPAGFVFPRVHAEAAFNINGTALLRVFASDLGEAAPELDINECRLLTLLAIVEGVVPVDGQANICDGAAFRGKLHFGVACDVSNEDDFIDVGHGFWVLGD